MKRFGKSWDKFPKAVVQLILASVMVVAPLATVISFVANAAQGDTSSIRLTLNAGEYEITKDEDGFDVIRMEEFPLAVLPGDPMLPHKVYNIIVPPDVIRSSLQLKIISAQTRTLDGTYDIEPASPPLPGTGDWRNDRNVNVYEADARFPENSVELLPYSQMRKWKFTRVDFFPFQYNPVSKKLTLTESVEIEIIYSQSRAPLDESLMADTAMDDIATQIFLNYSEARSWYEQEMPTEPQQTYDYVIITTNAIETNSTKLASLVTHKEGLGHSVLVITEDEFGVLTGQPPNHKAEKIREWLKNHYSAYSIEYVLLIGDPHPYESGEGDIPMKMCHPERNQTAPGYKATPTDYFYADLTGNWDKDGDQYYGEWQHDYPVTGGVDFAPEVYVGRIPVYDADYTTLDSILQKIIDYGTEPNADWRKSILMPISFQHQDEGYPPYDGAPLAEQMKDDYLDAAGFTSWRMYQQGSGACGLDSIYTSEQELRGGTVVRDRWAGTDYGIVAWWGHGGETGASVGYDPGCVDGTLMNSSYTSSLDDEHPSFVYQCSCTNGYPENSNNLQYAILKQGGIATVGATRASWYIGLGYGEFDGSPTNSGIGYEYVHRLVQGLPGGSALYQAKQSMNPDRRWKLMNWYDFNLYGDPAISLESAGALAVASITPSSGLNTGTVHITNLAGSNFQSGATVKLTKSGQPDINATNVTVVSASRITCDFNLTGAATGQWDVVVTNPDTRTAQLSNGFTVTVPGATKVYLPLVVRNHPPSEWVTILSEDFEGTFPGSGWVVVDGNSDSGLYYWGKRDCRSSGGSFSAWSVGAGDTTLSCGSDYPNDVYAWMIYGPFDLSNATAAELIFDWWSDTEADYYDYFFWGASTGYYYYGTHATGDWSSWTTDEVLDLSDVPTLGSLLGEDQVWIAFVFRSNSSITNKGSFVDNVWLRKQVGSAASRSERPESPRHILQSNQTMEFVGLRRTR